MLSKIIEYAGSICSQYLIIKVIPVAPPSARLLAIFTVTKPKAYKEQPIVIKIKSLRLIFSF